MKKILTTTLAALLVVGMGVSGLSVNAASTTKLVDANNTKPATESPYYDGYHQGHMDYFNNRNLTEAEYQAELKTYKEERRKEVEASLKKDVDNKVITQAEADQYLADFDSMSTFCDGHGGGHYNNTNNGTGYGRHHNGNGGGRHSGRGNGGGRHCW